MLSICLLTNLVEIIFGASATQIPPKLPFPFSLDT